MNLAVNCAYTVHTELPRRLAALSIPDFDQIDNPLLHFERELSHDEISQQLQITMHQFDGDYQDFINHTSSVIKLVCSHFYIFFYF
jgi:hypothetical protein